MAKVIFIFAFIILIILSILVWKNAQDYKKQVSPTGIVHVYALVEEYLIFSLDTGNISFGNLNPGDLVSAPAAGVTASATTNNANGYNIGLSDGAAGQNSALKHTDGATTIPDYAATILNPTSWSGNGLGVTLFAADTNKEAKWGIGSAFNDPNNNYAGIPQYSAIAHTAPGIHLASDKSSWAFNLEIPMGQKVGHYSGQVAFSATTIF